MKKTMTSRERVIAAVEHRETDRVPIDFGMHFSSGISAFAYHDLLEYLGESTDNIKVSDMVQFLARIDDKILKMFHSDCKMLYAPWPKEKVWNPRGKYNFRIPSNLTPVRNEDGDWIISYKGDTIRMPDKGYFFDGGWPWFHPYDFDVYIDETAKEAEKIYNESEYFTAYHSLGAFFQENPDYLCEMLIDPDNIIRSHESWLIKETGIIDQIVKKIGRNIQGIVLNSDLGTQNGPFCDPLVYEKLSAPFLKKLCTYIHDNSDYKIILHTCGSIEPMIPILIDCGIDAINPVQISARNMDPKHLKSAYGDKMTFWGGGCDTQRILGPGSESEVRANVRELMDIFKKNQGFVFCQVHNIMGNVPPQNVIAMFDEAYKSGLYD
ncbi:hypothetical protein EOM86_00610 [Candidatus Nomurabacteria bacterium]|nr:hypothetical protein [Candidatus Nomurabacteria bacterium]